MVGQDRSILVAEDDTDDQLLLARAFSASNFEGTLAFAADGVDLIARLGEGAEMPDLVLLDLNMPRLSGFDVLKRLRGNERMRGLPVVVLTTSGATEDVISAYRNGANTYLQKPRSFPALVKMTEIIQSYWLNLAKLPN